MTEQPASGRVHFWLRPGFWRWSVRLLLAGILLLLAAAVWVLVHPPALEPLREDLEGWLSERLDRPVRFQEISWTWDSGFTVRAVDVAIGDKGVVADEVRLGMGAVALMRGELDLRSLALRGLELDLGRDARGRLYAGGLRLRPEKNRLFPFLARFEDVRIHSASLVWSDRRRSDPVRLVISEVSVDIERLSRGHLVNLTANAAGGRVSVHGGVEHFAGGPESWRLNVETRAEGVEPETFLPYLPEGAPVALPGRLSLWAEMVGGWHRSSRINGHFRLGQGQLRWPEGLRRPLSDTAVKGEFRYQGEPGSHHLDLEETRLTAGGVRVTGAGKLRWKAGFADPRLKAKLGLEETPVPVLRNLLAVRALPGPLVEWLDRSIADGRLEGGRAEIRGPLGKFPFANGEGIFRVEAKVAAGVLAYHPDWPPVIGLSGTLTVDQNRLSFRADSGRVLRSRIREATATVPDLAAHPARLRLRGKVGLELVDGVRFLEQSPLQSEGFLEPAVLAGPADLHLTLGLPLTDRGEPAVSGRLALDGAAFRPRPESPAVVNVDGQVAFQGGRIRASGLRGRLLGQPVTVDLDREPDEPFRAEVRGSFPAKALRTALARHGRDYPLSRRLTGEIDARLKALWGRQERHAELHADLEQAALILPEPAFNGIGDPGEVTVRLRLGQPWRVETSLVTGGDRWDMLATSHADGGWRLGLGIGLNEQAPPCKLGTCLVAGHIGRFPLKEWVDLWREVVPEGAERIEATKPQLQAELTVGSLRWEGRRFGGGRLEFSATPSELGYAVNAQFQGEAASGRISFQPGREEPDALRVRLESLELPDPGAWAREGDGGSTGEVMAGLDLALTMEAERLHVGQRKLENARLKARLQPGAWKLQQLRARMDGSNLVANGGWTAERGRTQLGLVLGSNDFGGLLRSLGLYPNMKGGHGSFSGDLWWPGRPTAFAVGQISGDLRLRMVEGEIKQFYFLNQALATLNVLDWPRQVARGFRDVAEGGLVYRELKGSIDIAEGVARTDDWVLKSAPLRLDMGGSLDLDARTYDLLLQVQPLQTVDRIISAVPVLGYLLAGESRTVMALGYRVKGPWADPEVTPLTGAEQENPVETLLRRLKEMEWQDVLPWH
ncbi:YhdP family phospholipid transporter [Thiohalorhabdus sp.]|uniref:YhdP family phospholipid transporter n=1 Tax=Thiohalorhabdus sp. TaxID=3094134 RepID=UPI002FC316A8